MRPLSSPEAIFEDEFDQIDFVYTKKAELNAQPLSYQILLRLRSALRERTSLLLS